MTPLRAAIDAACPPILRGFKARLEASPLATRLIRGTFWSLIGTVLSRSLGLLASIFVARMIGKVGMGELGIVQSTVGMFSTLAGLGLGLTATKHVAEHRVGNPVRVGETIGLLSLISWGSGLGMTLVILFLSPWLARHTLAATTSPMNCSPVRCCSCLGSSTACRPVCWPASRRSNASRASI